jgi:long-chain acyl-CoA synthetase
MHCKNAKNDSRCMPNLDDPLVAIFRDRVKNSPDRAVVFAKAGSARVETTWRELHALARDAARRLIALGVSPGDRVALVSENRLEWIVADLAIQLSCAVSVPIHVASTPKQVADLVEHCESKVAIVSPTAAIDSLNDLLPPKCRLLDVRWLSEDVHTAELQASEFEHADDIERSAVDFWRPDRLTTILYTSGTTGRPKGVMLSQRNLVSNTRAKIAAHEFDGSDIRLGVLPLSHIFARTCDWYVTLLTGGQLALAESRHTFFANCAEIRPTYLNAVPYFYDKCRRELVRRGMTDTPGALRELLGGRMRCCLSGGAPLPPHLTEFFWRQGVPLVEGYGLTETSPVVCDGTLHEHRTGTVGRPIPGVEVKLSDDGELLTRGPHVMLGYFKDQQATDDVIRDGWLSTGDLAKVDADGFITIVGRKKELIITAGGQNVSPLFLESLLNSDPWIAQSMVVGDRRNFLTALIVPDFDTVRDEMGDGGGGAFSSDNPIDNPNVREEFKRRIAATLTDVARYEQVRKFVLMARPFSYDRDEITTKGSLRRSVIAANFADIIEGMYHS